jgi:hypothetical protein
MRLITSMTSEEDAVAPKVFYFWVDPTRCAPIGYVWEEDRPEEKVRYQFNTEDNCAPRYAPNATLSGTLQHPIIWSPGSDRTMYK